MSYPTTENGLGLRRFMDVVYAFSCKLWWKWDNKVGLWAAYVRKVGWMKSVACLRLFHVDSFMRQHTRIFIRDGSCSFLFSDWTGLGCLVDVFDLPDLSHLRSLRLSDVWLHQSWDFSAIGDFLPSHVVEFISSYQFQLTQHMDEIIWCPAASGIFSVSSAFHTCRQKQQPRPDFKYLWSPAVPLRISIFGWRMLNSLLPFPEVLIQLGFSTVSKCYACASADSMDHCFGMCILAQQVWCYFERLLGVQLLQRDFFHTVIFCWHHNLRICPSLHYLIALLPLAVSWGIWRVRNSFLYSNQRPTAAAAIYVALDTLRSISISRPFRVSPAAVPMLQQLGGLQFVITRRQILALHWEKPVTFRLNTDGSSLQNGASGAGMVLRDSTGEVVFAASLYLGIATNFQAEIEALERGLNMCAERGYHGIEVDTDSMALVNLLAHRSAWPWRYRTNLQNIANFLETTCSTLRHRYREVNAVADALARLASSSVSTSLFDAHSLPLRIKGLTRLDQIGMPYVRIK